MAATITPSLRAALERLRNGGAVNGILLGWRRQVLINMLPYEDFRADRLLQAVHEGQDHFASGGDRLVQTFWFGYEACHALVTFHRDCALVILHARAEEGDFLRRAALTLLEDCQILIDDLLTAPEEAPEEETPGTVKDEDDLVTRPHTTNFIGKLD